MLVKYLKLSHYEPHCFGSSFPDSLFMRILCPISGSESILEQKVNKIEYT